MARQRPTASNGLPTLTYRGKPLSPEPSNVDMQDVTSALSSGRHAYVCLEPGDGTRYDFIIALLDDENGERFLVVRTNGTGGEMRATSFVGSDMRFEGEAADTLGDGNVHSARVFKWWLSCAWTLLGIEQRPDDGGDE